MDNLPIIFSNMEIKDETVDMLCTSSVNNVSKRKLVPWTSEQHMKKINITNNKSESMLEPISNPPYDRMIDMVHKAGWRRSVNIQKKEVYTLSDVKRIIDQIDRAWEVHCDEHHTYIT